MWNYFKENDVELFSAMDKQYKIRSGLTFTPYANPKRCNANCRFCSEKLRRKHQKNLTAYNTIEDYDAYFEGLTRVFRDLSKVNNIGLSLSGLEATNEPNWLERLLDLIAENKDSPAFGKKVLYTNSSGLYTYPFLVNKLIQCGFDALEISRCHYDDGINQNIMSINRDEPICHNEYYEVLIKTLTEKIAVKNSCILTQLGVSTLSEVEKYLQWKMNLGVNHVVFRELSRLNEEYVNTETKKWIDLNRVRIDSLLTAIMPNFEDILSGWDYQYSVVGYYYYNEHYRYKDKMHVVIEVSSYNELIHQSTSNIIHKLVFHSNGNLCGDWDPDNYVLANYF